MNETTPFETNACTVQRTEDVKDPPDDIFVIQDHMGNEMTIRQLGRQISNDPVRNFNRLNKKLLASLFSRYLLKYDLSDNSFHHDIFYLYTFAYDHLLHRILRKFRSCDPES